MKNGHCTGILEEQYTNKMSATVYEAIECLVRFDRTEMSDDARINRPQKGDVVRMEVTNFEFKRGFCKLHGIYLSHV